MPLYETRRLRERHRPSPGGHLDPVSTESACTRWGLLPVTTNSRRDGGIDDRRAADPVASGHDVRGPHGQPGRLVERDDVGIRVERGEREEETRVRRARGGLAARGPRRAAGLRGPCLQVEDRRRALVLRVAVHGNVALVSNVVSGAIVGTTDVDEARLRERRAPEDVVAALKDRLRSARPGVASRCAPSLARRASRSRPRLSGPSVQGPSFRAAPRPRP